MQEDHTLPPVCKTVSKDDGTVNPTEVVCPDGTDCSFKLPHYEDTTVDAYVCTPPKHLGHGMVIMCILLVASWLFQPYRVGCNLSTERQHIA